MQKISKTTILLLAIIAVLVITLTVVLAMTVFSGSRSEHAEQTNQTIATVPQTVVETPYCDLKYPTQWQGQMIVQAVSHSLSDEGNTVMSYDFYALIAGEQYALYSIYFGDGGQGNLFGYLPYGEADIPVYVHCYSIEQGSDLTETDMALYYSMMEGINELTQSIEAAPGYYKP